MKSTLLASAATIALAASVAAAADADAAQVKQVSFDSNGATLVGNLYLPDAYQAGDKLPAIVVTGAWTTVKEQMAGRYAEEMADRGFAALAFDFRNWGQSEGAERQLESPELKTQDIVAAASFLATRDEVDPSRIGGMGICASAGYMADAGIRSSEIGSVALVAPWLHDAEIVDAVYGGEEAVSSLIAASRDAQTSFEQTGEPVVVPAASNSDPTAIMQQVPYYTDPATGLVPEYINEFNIASWEPWLTYDATTLADDFADPILIVHSQSAAIPQGAEEFYARVNGPKAEIWLDGVTQFDFYAEDEAVRTSSDAAAEHFTQSFGS